MYSEEQLLPISALQHLLFCERQCALIHIEQLWAENRFTMEGLHLHRKAHSVSTEQRPGVRVARSLALRSFRLGLVGQADVVEFACPDQSAKWISKSLLTRQPVADPPSVGRLSRSERLGNWLLAGKWSVTPVEYKRGKPKQDNTDRVQLCAQAMCLEEMLGVVVSSGALFYGKRRRRTEVLFDQALRELTTSVATRLHKMIASAQTPPARREPKCDNCSLLTLCMPDSVGSPRPMSKLIDRAFSQHFAASAPSTDREFDASTASL